MNMDQLADEVLVSYETQIAAVERIIDAAHDMLDASRRQRDAVRTELRESLARAASLRRRDFDTMIHGVLARQDTQEVEVKQMIRAYLQEQRRDVAALKDTLAGRNGRDAESLTDVLARLRVHWVNREQAVRKLLADFRQEQEELARCLTGLLTIPGPSGVKAFKAVLQRLHGSGGPEDSRETSTDRAHPVTPRHAGRERTAERPVDTVGAPATLVLAALGGCHD